MVKFIKVAAAFLPALILADDISHSKFNSWAKEGNADAIRRHLDTYDGDKLEFVSAGDHWAKQATHYAAEHGHADVIDLLNNMALADVAAVDYRGRTPLHLAAMNGKIDVIKKLIKLNPEIIFISDKEGRNALHFAAEAGQYMTIRYLVGEGKLDVNSMSGTRKTALMVAAERGHVDFVHDIITKAGADQNLVDAVNMNAMMMAAKIGHMPIVSVLKNAAGGDKAISNTDAHGRNAFLFAVASGQSGLVDWMLNPKHGNVDISSTDKEGVNGLHLAAKYGHQNVCQQLINRYPEGMYSKDTLGQTPLHMSTRLPENGFAEILEFHTPLPLGKYTCLDSLLKANTKHRLAKKAYAADDYVNAVDLMSHTALSRAVEYGCSTTVNRLFKSGASPATTVNYNRRQNNMNMLHWAVAKDQVGVIDTLVRRGVDKTNNKMTPDRATPLLLAVKQDNYLATVKMLHYNNKDNNVLEIADRGRTPLIWAVANGNSDILKALIGNGANINYVADGEKHQLTALHFAAAKGDSEIVNILLHAGAKYDALDANRITPLDTALYYNNPTVLEQLIMRYRKDLGESDPDALTDMFYKAIEFANAQSANVRTLEEISRREDVLNILKKAAGDHFESIATDMELAGYDYDGDFTEYYSDYYYSDDFYGMINYDYYPEKKDKSRRKRSPRHLK